MGCSSIAGFPPSTKFASTRLYTWVERGTVRVNCPGQEHNAMSLVWSWTQTTQCGNECTCTYHEVAVPPTYEQIRDTFNSIKTCSLNFWTFFSSKKFLYPPQKEFYQRPPLQSLWKFQLGFIHVLNFAVLQNASTHHSYCNSNPSVGRERWCFLKLYIASGDYNLQHLL